MKILFVVCNEQRSEETIFFALGVGYLISILKNAKYKVEVLNCALYKPDQLRKIIKTKIKNSFPDVVAISAYTWNWNVVELATILAKECNPHIKIIGGGAMFSCQPTLCMDNFPYVDVACIGEGEPVIVDIIDNINDIEKLKLIPNCIVRDGDVVIRNEKSLCVEDLDSLPYPDFDALEYKLCIEKTYDEIKRYPLSNAYLRSFTRKAYREGVIMGARGCPFNCTFCDHSVSKKYRQRSLKSIIDEIDYQKNKYNIDAIAIFDDLFSNNKSRILEFCALMKDKGIKYRLANRVDTVSKEVLEAMYESGVNNICFGIESFDNTILKSMKKKITEEQITNALMLCKEARINAKGHIIIGDKNETLETSYKSLSWVISHPEYNIIAFFIMFVPNSALYLDACGRGLIKDIVQHNRDKFPLINASKMDDESFCLIKELSSAMWRGCFLPLSLKTSAQLDNNGIISVNAVCPHCKAEYNGEIIFNRENWDTWTMYLLQLLCENCYGKFVVPGEEVGSAIFNDAALMEIKKGRLELIEEGNRLRRKIESILAKNNLSSIPPTHITSA